MVESRRAFLRAGTAGLVALLAPGRGSSRSGPPAAPSVIKPPRLRPGDTVGLINPVSLPLRSDDVRAVASCLEGLGMRVACDARPGRSADERERASEINAFFADPAIRAILPIRGGWGSARLLPHLDYELIRRNPKILMGSSDVVSLLLGVHARTRLVTFHGPMGNSSWCPFTVDQMQRVLFRCEAPRLGPPPDHAAGDEEGEDPIWTIAPGRARGRLFGGNLTVVASIVGSPFLAGGEDLILFLEEVREPTSEVSRMLTQLELAGLMGRVRGLVFGQCTSCAPPEIDQWLTLDRVLADQVRPLGVPAWRGALIGHIERQLTLPIGVEVEIDADEGTIQLLEPAVC